MARSTTTKKSPRRAKKASHPWLEAFTGYLRAERHLAANTVLAYHRDVSRFLRWLGARQIPGLNIRQLADYARWLVEDEGLAPSSVGRHLVSLKMFFRYLQLEGELRQNLVELLGSPKLWQRVPTVLSSQQIDRLFAAPEPADGLWRRDRALLELLYATGCRASELSDMQLVDVHLDEGYCKCQGKGDKQRLTPLGRRAASALQRYLEKERPQLAARSPLTPSWLLLSRRGLRLRRERATQAYRLENRCWHQPSVQPRGKIETLCKLTQCCR